MSCSLPTVEEEEGEGAEVIFYFVLKPHHCPGQVVTCMIQVVFSVNKQGLRRPASTELFIENQAFSRSYDLAPPPPPPPPPSVSSTGHTQGRRERGLSGWGKIHIMRRREIPVLYRSFNTLSIPGCINTPKYIGSDGNCKFVLSPTVFPSNNRQQLIYLF